MDVVALRVHNPPRMNFLHKPLQRKLSAVVGAQVTFDKLNLSLLGGSLDAHGVVVTGTDQHQPVLTIRRIRAEISLGRALKGEIVIKSITVDQPVFSVVRGADGKTNIPPRIKPGSLDEAPEPEEVDEADDGEEEAVKAPRKWKLDVAKVLIVDGEAHFRSEMGGENYHASAEKLMAELAHQGDAFNLTVLVDSIARRDKPLDLGGMKITGQLTGVSDLSRAIEGGIRADVEVGDLVRMDVQCPSLAQKHIKGNLRGKVDLRRLGDMLPSFVTAVKKLALAGLVEFDGKGEYSPEMGLRLPEVNVRGMDVVAGE